MKSRDRKWNSDIGISWESQTTWVFHYTPWRYRHYFLPKKGHWNGLPDQGRHETPEELFFDIHAINVRRRILLPDPAGPVLHGDWTKHRENAFLQLREGRKVHIHLRNPIRDRNPIPP
jgi:hypothetical protein